MERSVPVGDIYRHWEGSHVMILSAGYCVNLPDAPRQLMVMYTKIRPERVAVILANPLLRGLDRITLLTNNTPQDNCLEEISCFLDDEIDVDGDARHIVSKFTRVPAM